MRNSSTSLAATEELRFTTVQISSLLSSVSVQCLSVSVVQDKTSSRCLRAPNDSSKRCLVLLLLTGLQAVDRMTQVARDLDQAGILWLLEETAPPSVSRVISVKLASLAVQVPGASACMKGLELLYLQLIELKVPTAAAALHSSSNRPESH